MLSPFCTLSSSSSCNNSMSSISPTPRNYNPSKPVVVHCVPTFSSYKSNNMPGLGHEDDDDDCHQVMLLHDKYDKSYSCSNGGVLQGSALVPRGHCSDENEKDSGRERLKRHREEVAGRVLIPDKWGKEELLKDWIDYSSFDSLLAPNGLASARKALMAEGRRSGSQRLMRIGSTC